MNTEVTVAVSTYRMEGCIHACMSSLLTQTFRDFEVVIVEDPAFDRTKEIVEAFHDDRIRYVRNETHLGLARSRNRCVELASGKYIFFTDADCIVDDNWIEEGLKCLLRPECVGVEGKTYYVSEDYKPTYSDRVIGSQHAGQFMTCNVAYKQNIIEEAGGFDERYTYCEDRDLALRVMRHGKICFNPEMLVTHQKSTMTPMQFVKQWKNTANRVLLYKRFGERSLFTGRIILPLHLMAIIFPPLSMASLFRNRYRTKEDFRLVPFNYLRLLYERLNFWKMCAKERVFLI